MVNSSHFLGMCVPTDESKRTKKFKNTSKYLYIQIEFKKYSIPTKTLPATCPPFKGVGRSQRTDYVKTMKTLFLHITNNLRR